MDDKSRKERMDALTQYGKIIERQVGHAIRPYRSDGFVNMLNKYGTSKDTTEHYYYQNDPNVPDETLTSFYEGSGIFARIIDAPAEECMRTGFELEGLSDGDIESFYKSGLDELDFKDNIITAVKWARLFGGSLIVMLIDDGRNLDEPLDWDNIHSIDDIKVYERPLIQPDTSNLFFHQNPGRRGSLLGEPEYYDICSRYGNFRVHESRCLSFRNGRLPENTTNSIYELWGMPEYQRVYRAVRDVEVSHGSGVKLLDKSVQAIYKMKGLMSEMSLEGGEDRVIKRLDLIDQARGLLNSIVIDADGEDYDFKSFSYAGVADVINTACNYLSSVTNIPQTVLFGRSPAGMNATGNSDLENYYNYVERIQERMLKKNIAYLLEVLFTAGKYTKEIDEIPDIDIKFNSLWSMSESERVALDQQKAAVQSTRAQTANVYVQMQALDPSEVRKALADSKEFDIEEMLDDYTEEELLAVGQDEPDEGAMMGGEMPPDEMVSESAPEMASEQAEMPEAGNMPIEQENDEEDVPECPGVGVLVVSEGKILVGNRHNDHGYGLWCGPGGAVEPGETPEQAAVRETQEEFGITPTELIYIGDLPLEPGFDKPSREYLCTAYEGEIKCSDLEMVNPRFVTMQELKDNETMLFQPFCDSIKILEGVLNIQDVEDEEAEVEPEVPEPDFSDMFVQRQRRFLKPNLFQRILDFINKRVYKSKINADNVAEHDIINVDGAESDWITANGAHIHLNENKVPDGKVGNAIREHAEAAKYKNEQVKQLGMGANKFEKPWIQSNLDNHWSGGVSADGKEIHAHSHEFKGMSKEGYAKAAQKLIESPVGGKIHGYVNRDGQIVRFNMNTGEFVKGNPNKGIATFFKAQYPKDGDGSKYRIQDAIKYFEGEKKKEAYYG